MFYFYSSLLRKNKQLFFLLILIPTIFFGLALSTPYFFEFNPKYVNENYKFLNTASGDSVKLEVPAIIDFLDSYRRGNIRVNRPTYYFGGHLVYLTLKNILPEKYSEKPHQRIVLGRISGLFVNYLFIIFTALIFYWLCVEYFDSKTAFLSLLLFSTSPLLFLGREVHTIFYAYFSTIAFAWYFHNIIKNKTNWARLIGGSFLVGILILGKPQYDMFFIFCTLCFLLGKRMEAIATTLFHFIPISLWVIFLKLQGIPYRNIAWTNQRQGKWILTEFLHYDFYVQYKTLTYYWGRYNEVLMGAYSFLFLGIILYALIVPYIIDRKFKFICVLSVVYNFLLLFAMRIRWVNMYPLLLFFIFYPITAKTIIHTTDKFIDSFKLENKRKILIGLFIMIIMIYHLFISYFNLQPQWLREMRPH